jgi:hypothetical protein
VPLHHQNKTNFQLTKLSGKCEKVQRERVIQPATPSHTPLLEKHNEIITGMLPSKCFNPNYNFRGLNYKYKIVPALNYVCHKDISVDIWLHTVPFCGSTQQHTVLATFFFPE